MMIKYFHTMIINNTMLPPNQLLSEKLTFSIGEELQDMINEIDGPKI